MQGICCSSGSSTLAFAASFSRRRYIVGFQLGRWTKMYNNSRVKQRAKQFTDRQTHLVAGLDHKTAKIAKASQLNEGKFTNGGEK